MSESLAELACEQAREYVAEQELAAAKAGVYDTKAKNFAEVFDQKSRDNTLSLKKPAVVKKEAVRVKEEPSLSPCKSRPIPSEKATAAKPKEVANQQPSCSLRKSGPSPPETATAAEHATASNHAGREIPDPQNQDSDARPALLETAEVIDPKQQNNMKRGNDNHEDGACENGSAKPKAKAKSKAKAKAKGKAKANPAKGSGNTVKGMKRKNNDREAEEEEEETSQASDDTQHYTPKKPQDKQKPQPKKSPKQQQQTKQKQAKQQKILRKPAAAETMQDDSGEKKRGRPRKHVQNDEDDVVQARKALASRKSSAYHNTKSRLLKEGKSMEVATAAAKKVPCLALEVRASCLQGCAKRMSCTHTEAYSQQD